MKIKLTSLAILLGASCLAACTSQTPTPVATASNATVATNPTSAPPSNTGVASAHGGGGGGLKSDAPASSSAPTSTAPAPPTQFDEKIAKTETKAKTSNAAADKQAAAAAYLERADYFRDAGQPQLYKFALGDYRHVLKYQPDNAKAKERMDEIVAIYQSMGRPIPSNGLEP